MAASTVEARKSPCSIESLRGLLATNRRRWRLFLVAQAVAMAISLPVAYFVIAVLFDDATHLNQVGRLLAWAGFVAVLVWATRSLVRRGQAMRLSEDQVALAIERRTAGSVGNRLINAVQLARGHNESRLADAVLEENVEALKQIRLEQAAQGNAAFKAVAFTAMLVAAAAGLWAWQQERFTNAASRILLPLAAIDPIFRTRLVVEPGDTEAMGDVPLRITIQGERPSALIITRSSQGKMERETAAPAPGEDAVTHVLKGVAHDTEYTVRGNDFVSPAYRITIPRRAGFNRLRATYRYPDYTHLTPRTLEATSGELEAVHGTNVDLSFGFDASVASARLVLDRPADAKGPAEVKLMKTATGEFEGRIVLEDLHGYAIEVEVPGKPVQRIGPFAVRSLRDQDPALELSGFEKSREIGVDSSIPLRISAQDDFGLAKVGLFYRMIGSGDAPGVEPEWKEIASWPCDQAVKWRGDHTFKAAGLPVAEGDRIEVAVRGQDTLPGRTGWTQGPLFDLVIGGEGAGLQLLYEQILRSERELADLARQGDELARAVTSWQLKLDGDGALRWDDPKNIDALHAAIKQVNADQDKQRENAGRIARTMPAMAGSLRLGVSLLADTEMVRVARILDAVPSRETPTAKRAALSDAKVTLDRMGRSLGEMRERYTSLRHEWEKTQMPALAKSLAERQHRLRQQSIVPASVEASPPSVQAHRQRKIHDAVRLITPAFTGLAERLHEEASDLASAYRQGAEVLAGESLKKAIDLAAAHLAAGRRTDAAPHQSFAASQLQDVSQRLRKAQIEAARKALAALRERAKSDPKAKAELDDLPPGIADALVKDFPDDLKLEDMVRLEEIAQAAKKNAAANGAHPDKGPPSFFDIDPKQLELQKDSGVRQDTNTLKLGNTSEKTAFLELPNADKFNAVKPFIQEKFDDLVGKLLDEADELDKQYQTLKLSTNQNNNDPGEINKQGGKINSTGAVAATGNKKPPTTEAGGVARTGRQGARAYGMVADKVAPDMRGRDKALDGMQEAPDQKGIMKLQKTPDPQQDFGTGVGGKKVESDDTHFSLHDAGKWKDDMVKRMDKAQKKHYIVERQGEKLDPKVAAQLRDLTSQQEQVIERLKAIKRELRNLYLPTDHLDELSAALKANLERLKEEPDPEIFRLQLQTLDRLRGAARVFHAASSHFQPSVARDRRVQGRVVDGPPVQPLPGYEEALKGYYLRLADQ